MSEIIERLARALSERENSGPWEGGLMGERGRQMWRATARAAIEVVRDAFYEVGNSSLDLAADALDAELKEASVTRHQQA